MTLQVTMIEYHDRTNSMAVVRKAERDISHTAWSNRWSRDNASVWTHRILPDLRIWVKRRSKDITFHVTQAVTGPWCFRHYLHMMERTPNVSCMPTPVEHCQTHNFWVYTLRSTPGNSKCVCRQQKYHPKKRTGSAEWPHVQENDQSS